MHKDYLPHKADVVGIIASSLCLLHCIATPLLLAMGAAFFTHPIITYLFLVVSFFAIYKSSQKPTHTIIRWLLWLHFGGYLLAVVLHETLHTPEVFSYVFATLIILTHVSNIAYCKYCNAP
jgi:hypothetical protein